MDVEAFRKAGHATVDRIADYYATLGSRQVSSSVRPGEIGALLPEAPPAEGEAFEAISKDFDRVVLPGITHWQHPSFFAYFPANSTFECIIADMFAGAVSNPGFNWSCSPASTELEVVMMDWVAGMLGLSDDFKSTSKKGGGIIMGSASEACLTVCVAARERALRYLYHKASNAGSVRPAPVANGALPFAGASGQPQPAFEKMTSSQRAELTGRLVMYGSTQTHSSGQKAAMILGLQWRALEVRREDGWALRGSTLRAALAEDAAKGLVPCMLIDTMGTTNSGAIDRLGELLEVACEHPSMWVHVDAAWAGVYLSIPEYRGHLGLDAINRRAPGAPASTVTGGETREPERELLRVPAGMVHSFNTNLHKAGLVTFDCSALFVRDRALLTDALDLTPAYLKTQEGEAGAVVDYRSWQLPLGRRFRSMKVWFVLRSHGVEGVRAHLRRTAALAERFERLVSASPAFELVAARSLGLVVFRWHPPGAAAAATTTDLNELNRRLDAALQARSDLAVTGTVIGGERCIRLAVGSPRTRAEHVEAAWKLIQDVAEKLRA